LSASGSNPYIGSITVTIPNANGTPQVTNSTITVPINLTVHPQPLVTMSPAAITFNYTTGQPATAPPSANLSVLSSSNLDVVTVSADQPWVNLVCSVAGAPVSCSGISATSIQVVASINLATAPAGGGTATIKAAGTFGPTDVATTAVNFIVSPAPSIVAN